MRRLSTAMAAVALLLVFAAPVAAVRPDHEPEPQIPLSFGAGEVCNFAVDLTAGAHNQRRTTFYDRDGNPRATIITGRSSMRATSEFGEFFISIGGRASLGGDADTFILDGWGITALYFFPGDATPVGVGDGGLFVVKGNFHEVLDLTTNVVTEFKYRGTLIDVCAALAPPT